jgi:hypothetical protein
MKYMLILAWLLSATAFAAKPQQTQRLYTAPVPGTDFWCNFIAINGAGIVNLDSVRIVSSDFGVIGAASNVETQWEDQIVSVPVDGNAFVTFTQAYCYVVFEGDPDDIRGEICSDWGACSQLR